MRLWGGAQFGSAQEESLEVEQELGERGNPLL